MFIKIRKKNKHNFLRNLKKIINYILYKKILLVIKSDFFGGHGVMRYVKKLRYLGIPDLDFRKNKTFR